MSDLESTNEQANGPGIDAGTGTLRITLVKSTIGRPADQGRTADSLGLRRLHQTVDRENSSSVRGMVFKIRHLVAVEEIDETGTVTDKAEVNTFRARRP